MRGFSEETIENILSQARERAKDLATAPMIYDLIMVKFLKGNSKKKKTENSSFILGYSRFTSRNPISNSLMYSLHSNT